MGTRYPQVYFLPWAKIPKKVTIGPVSFWPYSQQAWRHISNKDVREYLDKYFKCFVGNEGKPRNRITICSYGDGDFQALDEEERRELRSAVDVLVFMEILPKVRQGISANSKMMGPPSADAFELFERGIDLKSPGISIKTPNRTMLFSNASSLMFAMPYTVGDFYWTLDDGLIEGFSQVFSLPPEKQVPYFRSLEWFRKAHESLGQFSPLTKLVMMAIAFEVLLDLPEKDKKYTFAKRIDEAIANDKFISSERTRFKSGNVVKLSLAGCWAWDFYELRSKIVHGDVVDNEELRIKDWITHLEVADAVFYEFVVRKLFKDILEELPPQKGIKRKARSRAKKFDMINPEDKEELPLESIIWSMFGPRNYYKMLGWIT